MDRKGNQSTMAIIVGDIHGNLEKVQAFLNYRPDQPHIALGDYVDSFGEPLEWQLECLIRLLDSNALLLWGNHDLHYLKNPPFECSGYQKWLAYRFRDIYEQHRHRFRAACAVDGWLCTHAGVSRKLSRDCTDPKMLAERLNRMMDRYLEGVCRRSAIFYIGRRRGGLQRSGGIFWFDNLRETGLAEQIPQIIGHTEQEPVATGNLVTLDTTNNYRICTLYDTQINELVKIEMPNASRMTVCRYNG
jgi:hypothetical protein